jgi:hypothetical protein
VPHVRKVALALVQVTLQLPGPTQVPRQPAAQTTAQDPTEAQVTTDWAPGRRMQLDTFEHDAVHPLPHPSSHLSTLDPQLTVARSPASTTQSSKLAHVTDASAPAVTEHCPMPAQFTPQRSSHRATQSSVPDAQDKVALFPASRTQSPPVAHRTPASFPAMTSHLSALRHSMPHPSAHLTAQSSTLAVHVTVERVPASRKQSPPRVEQVTDASAPAVTSQMSMLVQVAVQDAPHVRLQSSTGALQLTLEPVVAAIEQSAAVLQLDWLPAPPVMVQLAAPAQEQVLTPHMQAPAPPLHVTCADAAALVSMIVSAAPQRTIGPSMAGRPIRSPGVVDNPPP